MDEKELKEYRRRTLPLGVMSMDSHGLGPDGKIIHTPVEEQGFEEAIACALVVAEITNGFFSAAVAQDLIKLRY